MVETKNAARLSVCSGPNSPDLAGVSEGFPLLAVRLFPRETDSIKWFRAHGSFLSIVARLIPGACENPRGRHRGRSQRRNHVRLDGGRSAARFSMRTAGISLASESGVPRLENFCPSLRSETACGAQGLCPSSPPANSPQDICRATISLIGC